MKMKAFGKSITGKVRELNEDYIFVSDDFCVVSDGMGGHNAGEVASSLAVRSFVESFHKDMSDNAEALECLVNAIGFANSRVNFEARVNSLCNGMGTTLSACFLSGDKLYSVHVGDSRIYLINSHGIKQLTNDHTYVNEMVRMGRLTHEQAINHPQKNIITKAIGINETIEADAFINTLSEDDLILLCSDGLTTMLNDDEIFKTIMDYELLEEKVEKLIEFANENGGTDNISVILIDNGVME